MNRAQRRAAAKGESKRLGLELDLVELLNAAELTLGRLLDKVAPASLADVVGLVVETRIGVVVEVRDRDEAIAGLRRRGGGTVADELEHSRAHGILQIVVANDRHARVVSALDRQRAVA